MALEDLGHQLWPWKTLSSLLSSSVAQSLARSVADLQMVCSIPAESVIIPHRSLSESPISSFPPALIFSPGNLRFVAGKGVSYPSTFRNRSPQHSYVRFLCSVGQAPRQWIALGSLVFNATGGPFQSIQQIYVCCESLFPAGEIQSVFLTRFHYRRAIRVMDVGFGNGCWIW